MGSGVPRLRLAEDLPSGCVFGSIKALDLSY